MVEEGDLGATPTMESVRISDVVVGDRFRKDLGDLAALKQSISEIGLLHPIVINEKNELIAGARRIEACKQLGWEEIPARRISLNEIVRGEFDENVIRKEFTLSEMAAISKAVRPVAEAEAKERAEEGRKEGGKTAGKGRPKDSYEENFLKPIDRAPQTRDRVAKLVGVSGRTLEKIEEVVDAAEAEPEKYGELVEKMDKSGKVNGAFKELNRLKKSEAIAKKAEEMKKEVPVSDRYRLLCRDIEEITDDDIKPESVDLIVTDPPYGREYLPLYESLAKLASRVLKPGGSLLVMTGQSYLPEVLNLMTPHIGYHWTLCYLTPGGQSVQLWQRKANTFWKPVLWLVKGEYADEWVGDVVKSAVNDNEKELHEWQQSESGMEDLVGRFAAPGKVILDPFCGSCTTGVAALKHDCYFIGVDMDAEAIQTSERRLAWL